jgi:hypothetical protein
LRKKEFLIFGVIISLLLVIIVFALPSLTTVTLSSSNNTDTYLENLSITTDQDDNASVKLIYNWYKDDNSITVLNMPFEADGDQNATDYSGYDNDGTVTSTTWSSSSGYDGKGAHYFGYYENDAIVIDYNESLDLQSFSISFWLNIDEFNDWSNWIVARPYDCASSYDPFYEYGISYFTGNGLEYRIDGGYASTQVKLTENSWNHIVQVHNGTNTMIYVNGSLAYTGIGDSSINYDNDCGIRIGTDVSDGSDFNGYIDDLIIFNHSISAGQVLALYENKTDTIVTQEISIDDLWNATVTPNDGTQEGTTLWSNTLTILEEAAEEPEAVPEFSDYAIALLLLTIVGGFFVMRRK